jgi:sensor histidine kinase YesM
MINDTFIINICPDGRVAVFLSFHSGSMKRWYDKMGGLTKRFEVLLYIGLLCWMALFDVLEKGVYFWTYYGSALLVLFLVYLPVLVFSWNRERWKQSLSGRRYLQYWLACFGVYLGLLFVICSIFLEVNTRFQQLIPLSALFVFLLELLLTVIAWYRKRALQWQWIKRLSLERSVLISIVLIAVLFSIMAVSSMGNPEYDRPGGLLLGFEFNFWKVLTHFGVFLSFLVQFLFMYLCGYFFFYINNRVLVPRVLKQKGVVMYILAGLATVSITYPIIAQLISLLPVNDRLGMVFSDNPFLLENAFGAILIILLSLPVVLALQWSKQNSRIMSLEKEKAETELDLLKQQLNPHFFFNTLNNLYALSLAQSTQTPESILQLSELMRYVIYKAKEPAVSVQEEVKYLEDYMQLQQIRLKRKPDVRFTKEIAGDTPPVAPLLLIVLVENAFKHGVEPAEGTALLHLSLYADASRLHFTCVNSFEQEGAMAAGIGLANLERRLALLYPGKHRLKTGIESHTFKAELELDLT